MTNSSAAVVVVTGASSGIGLEVARTLAGTGSRVIALGRDRRRMAEATGSLARDGLAVEWIEADFGVLDEVRAAARSVAARTSRIDLLVNNAGALFDSRGVTPDGFERTFQVNHLAPFLLTTAWLGLLRAAPAAQVVTTSSIGHAMIDDMQWDDPQLVEDFTPLRAYAQSKLANILFTRELARRGEAWGLVASAVHPGLVASRFPDSADAQTRDYYAAAARSGEALTSAEGADTIVWLAGDVERARPSGGYFHERRRINPSPAARSDDGARRLWEVSERFVTPR